MFTNQSKLFRTLILTTLCFFSLAFVACEKDEDEALASFDCSNTSPTYTNDIAPLLNSLCATPYCHSSTTQAGGIDLSSYMAAETESSKARFLGAINQLSSYEPMPRGGSKLDDEDIKLLTCWVDNNSPE